MTQRDPIPCDCEMWYFCLEVLITGIYHKKKNNVLIKYECNIRIGTDKCTTDRVKIKDYSRYYGMCHGKQNNDLTLSMMDRKRKTQNTGCPQCDEHLFKYFW